MMLKNLFDTPLACIITVSGMAGLNSNPPLMNPNQPEGTSGHENWGKILICSKRIYEENVFHTSFFVRLCEIPAA
jgi:hypothetical protein